MASRALKIGLASFLLSLASCSSPRYSVRQFPASNLEPIYSNAFPGRDMIQLGDGNILYEDFFWRIGEHKATSEELKKYDLASKNPAAYFNFMAKDSKRTSNTEKISLRPYLHANGK